MGRLRQAGAIGLMPWLADVARHLDAREDQAPVLTRPCTCCADPACRCVTAYCRDSLVCTRHCRCDRCRAAWRTSTAHPVDHARRRIERGELWFDAKEASNAA